MKIVAEATKYHSHAFEFDFAWDVLNKCRNLKNTFGWQEFTFFLGKWRFANPKMAVYLKNLFPDLEIADEGLLMQMDLVKEEAEQDVLREKQAIEIKAKTDTDFEVKNVKANLYGYQKVAVEFFVNNNGRVILASDIGTGKTLMACSYVAHTQELPGLVICPASMKLAWEREIRKWTDLTTCVMNSKTDLNNLPVADMYIINYDILSRFEKEFLTQMPFKVLIIDESHLVKSYKAQRTKSTEKIAKRIRRVLMLSGTPLLNCPADLFQQLKILDPAKWSNWKSFVKRYCANPQSITGYDNKSASNIEELKEKMAKYFIRFRKEDVLKDLPPKVFIDVPVALNNGYAQAYEFAMASLIDYLIKAKNKTLEEAEKSEGAKHLVLLNELRQITTACKAGQAKELIESILEAGEKVIVFSVFNQPLVDLQELFKDKSVLLLGSTAIEDRQVAIDKFQNDPNTQIFFGGTKASGVGITLTAASHVLFLDQPWTAADYAQAYGRAERIGNKAECIKIHQMMCASTVDEKIASLIEEKKKIFDQIFNGGAAPEKSNVVGDLLEQIKRENNI